MIEGGRITNGNLRFQSSLERANTVAHSHVSRGGYDNKYRRLQGIDEYSQPDREIGGVRRESTTCCQKSAFSQEKYKFFLDADFEIDNRCCRVMKKDPIHRYDKETGRHGITAQMASESRLRTQKWLENGCNAFDLKNPISNPMSFWTEQDVLLYIYLNKTPIASVYGEVVIDYEAMGQLDGQMSLFEYDQMELGLFEKERLILKTTGCSRTGCIFCGFGCHLEKGENRWERLKRTHPGHYQAAFGGGRYEYKVFDRKGSEVKVKRVEYDVLSRWCEENKDNPAFLIRKTWKPYKGFGYKHVIDWINEHGKLNIRY